ncbi:MAG TPA: AAA domain-containing protein, partial [Oscillospiraceae bacterium]|nr:AAA domain-containing protein [Oscillospiraceae bacterium]
YRVYYEKIIYLYNKKDIYSNRIGLLEKLATVAPDWAEAIKTREGIHGNSVVPKDIESAWKWSQLNSQINRINSYDSNKIQREIDKINEALMVNARKLAYEKAWYYKIKNTTDEQIQAIKGWRQTMKQVGKGTGKNAPRLLKKARELMPRCQTAIPVWIMPLNRVAENFDPQSNKFDVVIIDEASQADLLALSALYLGEKIIIVGDDEQVSPNPVGIKIHEINALIEQHLQDIPLNHLYNVQTSIYDMAQNSGFKPLMLTEHFRCLPEIIEFSNGLSYNNKIRPLRDASQVDVKPAVIPYRVLEGFKTPDKTNKMEAEHIVSLICACIENEEYKGKTMGVISLVGQKQAYEIDKLLQSKLEPRDYESRKIQCGNPAQFQGDERDIIFLSIVDGPNEDGTPIKLISESGRNDMDRKRYNVAASRAKDQMWVIYSLNPEIDLKPGDIRLRLIKHVLNPSVVNREKQLNKAESDFEKKVIKSLQNRGYDVNPQWEVGLYRIDIVIKDGDKRIAIECDGERWHTLDNLAEDMKRQAILERLGWRFIRIRGSQFYTNPEGTMEWVFAELGSYDIKPVYRNTNENIDGDMIQENKLLEGIKRRANEIRIEWNGVQNGVQKEIETIHEDKAIAEEVDIQKITAEIKINNVEPGEEIVREAGETEAAGREDINTNKSSDIPMFDFTKNKTRKEMEDNIDDKPDLNAEKKEKDPTRIEPLFDFREKMVDYTN